MPSGYISTPSIWKTTPLTRTAILVGNVSRWLCIQVTDYEATGTREHGHGGGKKDR